MASYETQTVLGLKAPLLSIAYIAAMLETEFTVTIIDATVADMSHDFFGKKLQSLHPDVIGITSMTPTIRDVLKTVIVTAENCPDAVTVMGGCHITTMPFETVSESPQLDIGVIGEGFRNRR